MDKKYEKLLPNTMFRVVKDPNNPYVMINKNPLQDKTMSAKAKGILAYLLSLPNDWVLHLDELTTHFTDGVTSIKSGVKELKEKGYVQHVAIREGKGTKNSIAGKIHLIFELPHLNPFPKEKWDTTVHITKQNLQRLLNQEIDWTALQDENRLEGKNTPKEKIGLQDGNPPEGGKSPSSGKPFRKKTLQEENRHLLNNDHTDNDMNNNNDDDKTYPWDHDSVYKKLVELTEKHGGQIRSHRSIYAKYLLVTESLDTKTLLNRYERYLENRNPGGTYDKGNHSDEPQIAWFLADGYKNFPDAHKSRKSGSRRSNRSNKEKKEDVPRAVQQAMEREAKGEKTTAQPVDPETEARLQAKMKHLNQMLEKKERQNA